MAPAVTLAGALALAGCGGGNGNKMDEKEEMNDPPPSPVSCNADGSVTAATSAGCKAALDAAGATEAAAKARTDTAKALKAALAKGTDIALSVMPAATTLDAGRGQPETPDLAAITLKKQDAMVAALGGWTGADWKGEEGTAPDKNTGEARLYTNQGAGKTVSFAEGSGLTAGTAGTAGTYTGMMAAHIAGFPAVGQQTYEDDDEVEGTYRGVSGTYTCDGECTSVPAAGGGFTLANSDGTGWTFKPVPGATIRETASEYLYFGWWVRKDKDGKPTHSRAVYGNVGIVPVTGGLIDDAGLIGKAAYTGKAAGKFAVSDPLDAAKDGSGHFTADAMLTADFKASGSALEGTIDGFRLNDGTADPGWTVKLKEAAFDANNNSKWENTSSGTEWHVGEAKGGASGSWQAQMYAGDNEGNNTPADVIGSFHSTIGSTHEMRGAFGAGLDD